MVDQLGEPEKSLELTLKSSESLVRYSNMLALCESNI